MMSVPVSRCRLVGPAGAAFFAVAAAVVPAGSVLGGPVVEPQQPTTAPLADLTADQLDRFELGRQQFIRDFTAEEGLGPIFNQTACGDCHLNPVGATGTQKVLRAGENTKAGFDPLEEFGGSLFQLEAIDDACLEMPPPFSNVDTDRVTNGMTGYGLVEAIPDADIIALADPGDTNGDGVSGRVHMVEALDDPGVMRAGRFGWKAQQPTILSFTADAMLNEMGITNRVLFLDNDPNGINPPTLAECDPIPDDPSGMEYEDGLEFGNGVDREFLDVTTDFQRFMTQPPQTPKSGMNGEAIFMEIGCGDCHVPAFTTADDPELEEVLRNRTIRPYSDFLLHNMGFNGDGIPQGDAAADELKTPPLWGVALRPALWHDGRFEAGTIETRLLEAIAAHDDGFDLSEPAAAAAAQAFAARPQADQDDVVAFLMSLGRREFDFNLDNSVNAVDFNGLGDPAGFLACFGAGPYTPDDLCAVHDIDQDGDVDGDDFVALLSVYDGLLSDCNNNGIVDLQDILDGTSTDANGDGVPDACEPTCPGDLDGDGVVGSPDFLQLLDDWGPCPALPAPCESDLDRDGSVGVTDFLQLLAGWGSCS